ncbi:MAG: hypothetical protein ACI37J_05385 [Candidatus Bruticola sp.]
MDVFDDTFYVTEDYLDFHFYDDSSDSELSNGADNLCALHEVSAFGKNVLVVGKKGLDFSFFYSTKEKCKHGLRVKIIWDRNRCKDGHFDGRFEPDNGDWSYKKYDDGRDVPKRKIFDSAINFVRRYTFIFVLVWEELLNTKCSNAYFYGEIPFEGLFDGLQVNRAKREELYRKFQKLKRSGALRDVEDEEFRDLLLFESVLRKDDDLRKKLDRFQFQIFPVQSMC